MGRLFRPGRLLPPREAQTKTPWRVRPGRFVESVDFAEGLAKPGCPRRVFSERPTRRSTRLIRSSVAGVLEPDLQAVRALEAGGVPDVEGIRVHVIVDALGDLRVAIQELAEEGFGDFLLENRRLRLQGAALLVTRWRAFGRSVTSPAAVPGRQGTPCSPRTGWRGRRLRWSCRGNSAGGRYAAIYPRPQPECQV